MQEVLMIAPAASTFPILDASPIRAVPGGLLQSKPPTGNLSNSSPRRHRTRRCPSGIAVALLGYWGRDKEQLRTLVLTAGLRDIS